MPADTLPEGDATGATAEPVGAVLPAAGAPPHPAINVRQRAADAAASIYFLFIFIRILSQGKCPQAALCAAPVFVLLALLYPPKIKVTLNDSRSQKTITKYFIAKPPLPRAAFSKRPGRLNDGGRGTLTGAPYALSLFLTPAARPDRAR